MEYLLPDGIPKRTAACRCVLGNLRSDPLTNESSETTINYTYITGCAERAGSHEVNTDPTDGYITNLSGFKKYPSKLPTSTNDPNTHLVIKARGVPQMDGNGNPIFPSIKLTLRPLSSELDYTWLGDAGSRRQNTPVNELGENEFGEIIVDDFPPFYTFEGSLAQLNLSIAGDNNGCPQYYTDWNDQQAFNEAFNQNYAEAVSQFGEYGAMQFYKGEFYYRAEDLPPNLDPATYAPPLKPQEIDLTLYPHISGEEAYEFKINESWDLRYRYPSWWNERGGLPYYDEADTKKWIWEQSPVLETTNPYFPTSVLGRPLVPVEKFLRIYDPEGFPANPTSGQTFENSIFGHQSRPLFQGGQIQAVSIVRKRYPYSFDAKPVYWEQPQTFNVLDYNPQNYQEYTIPPVGNSGCDTIGYSPLAYAIFFQGNNTYGDTIERPEQSFRCVSRWRMELQVNRDEWNFDESLQKGWKVRGKIVFGKKILAPASSNEMKIGANTNTYSLAITSCISRVPSFPVDFYQGIDEYLPAGEMDFEVEVTKGNSTGEPIAVLEIPIGEQIVINEQVVQCGDRPEQSINFISDFYITEIIPPQ